MGLMGGVGLFGTFWPTCQNVTNLIDATHVLARNAEYSSSVTKVGILNDCFSLYYYKALYEID